jgi:hypothetical protein
MLKHRLVLFAGVSMEAVKVMWVLVLLAGCGAPTATPTPSPPPILLPSPIPAQPGQPAAAGIHGCRDDEYSNRPERIGVLRSTDRGATWTFLGDACFHAPDLTPVDPSPAVIDQGIALYFVDIATLGPGQPDTPRLYRANTADGLEFSKPAPAFVYADFVTDPYILRMPDGTCRAYMLHPCDPAECDNPGIVSAFSSDGKLFTLEGGIRTKEGGIPGALFLPDHQVRLFVGHTEGIYSFIGPDGLAFTQESSVRILSNGGLISDPHPISLRTGGYLMAYSILPPGNYADDFAKIAAVEIRLASSTDGFNWTLKPEPIWHGGVPGLVETEDGTLLIYFVDVNHK